MSSKSAIFPTNPKIEMKATSIIGIIVLAIATSNCGTIGVEGEVTSSDFPKELGLQADTIEITYIAWACTCPNWLPDEYFDLDNDKLSEKPEDYCIFIEAEQAEMKIPDEYQLGGYRNRIRLIGRYYKDKGISRDYEQQTPQKPEKARVFRYSHVEVIKPYSIWDFTDKDEEGRPKVKTIEKEMKAFYE